MRCRPHALKVRWLMLALFIWVTHFPVTLKAAQVADNSRVLALYWYGKDFPSNVNFDRGLQAAFETTGIEYYAEYFEPNLFPGESQALALRDYLHRKYSERRIDVLVAMSVVSADFLLKFRDELFPDVPIVLHTVTRSQLDERIGGAAFTGVIPENLHGNTLDLALRLHKATEQVFVINGTIERDKSIEAVLRENLSEFDDNVRITYLTDPPLDQLLSRVKAIPERSLILYSRLDYEDPQLSLSTFEVLALIAASAKVPIYSSGIFVGNGTIGGYATNTYECGMQAGLMAQQIINGTSPRDIPVVEVANVPIFDWRQLQRWGISESDLPSAGEVRFKELTFFEQYKWHIIAALTLCVFQSVLITGLLSERRRRRRTEAALRERLDFETLLSELSADFNTTPPDEMDKGIEAWLQRLASLLGADSADLLQVVEDGRSRRQRSDPLGALAIPIHVNTSAWQLVLSSPPSRQAWSEDLLSRLRLAGEILAGALSRRISNDALLESQNRYKLATSSGRVFVWDWNLETSEFYSDPPLASLLGYEDGEVLSHFDDWIRLIHPEDIDFVLARVRGHIEGSHPRFEVEHRLFRKDGDIRWFLATGTLLEDGQGTPIRIVGTDTDITERKLAEQEMQHLSARLLDSQDQERRRIARELHDGTAQNLCAIGLTLECLKTNVVPPARFQHMLSECQAMSAQSLQEVRTLSYVLHPPMLDKAGLLASLRWYVHGFSKRSGISVELSATNDIGRLPEQIEMDLFRVVQECLANVHRHSGSRTAKVEMEREDATIVLRVRDCGRGMKVLTPHEETADYGSFGVGLSGMRERVRHLGGRLEIASSSHGTTVTAIVPLTHGGSHSSPEQADSGTAYLQMQSVAGND